MYGVKAVVVFKEGFAVLDDDGSIDPLGTKYTCLTAAECHTKFGIKEHNWHYMNRFMDVK